MNKYKCKQWLSALIMLALVCTVCWEPSHADTTSFSQEVGSVQNLSLWFSERCLGEQHQDKNSSKVSLKLSQNQNYNFEMKLQRKPQVYTTTSAHTVKFLLQQWEV